MIRKAIIVVLLARSSLIVWWLAPYHVPSFVLTLLVLLTAGASLFTHRPSGLSVRVLPGSVQLRGLTAVAEPRL